MSDMPFFQKSSPNTGVHPFDDVSTEEDGFEVIHDRGQTHEAKYISLDGFDVFVGLSDRGSLDDCQLQFINQILERAERTNTPFFPHFPPLRLTERTLRSKDPAFQKMCSRGIELLGVDPLLDEGDIALAARRTADAAEAFLATPAARDQLRKFGLEIRLRAREVMEARIRRAPQRRDPAIEITPQSNEFAVVNRERARLMAEFLGVHRAPEVPGVDFILDAHGKVAYAFKPMTAAAVEAVCMARLLGEQPEAMGVAPQTSPLSTAMIVTMPECLERDAAEAGEAEETLGVLMMPPPGFNLCLTRPDEGEDVGRRRLADALARPLRNASFDQLALAALTCGEHRFQLDGVLVDEDGRAWMLDHQRLFAYAPADTDSAAAGPGRALDWSTTPRAPADKPMSPETLRALAEMDVEKMKKRLVDLWKPSPREKRLLGNAFGKMSKADIDALARQQWPGEKDLSRVALRLGEVRDWARHCVRLDEKMSTTKDPLDVKNMREVLSEQSSIRWLLSTFAPTGAGDGATA
ncbi:hypothetical protein [Mitsuaria sp. 7]|uniref:hypothetical protein n=1 Tax=Mitsuaria sp. 7 TaxID=1658665 RepID=UPI0007DCF360|nr:hypothetical protein [Mitsuaria sp. 7]ANH67543.1 hypothetical protein ABE85_08125 [Mitsuaria sp. 7]